MRLIAALFALLLALPAAAQDGRANTILVLDGSGSMWGQIDGVNKIVIAREVVDGLLQDFPADQNLGLTVYGHRTRGDCTDIETVVAPGPDTLGAISEAVNAINPRGKTPMTDAVIAAAEALRYTEEKATVILVSDGVETCNPDPCAAARALEQAGIDFTAHVVGFDVTDPEALAQMQCLADETGGQFLTAANADELTDALTTVAVEPEPIVVTATFQAVEGEGGPLITDPILWYVTSDSDVITDDEEGNPLSLSLLEGTYRATAYRVLTETERDAVFTVSGPDAVSTTIVFPAPPPPPVDITFSARIGEDGPEITDPVIYTISPAPEGMEAEQTGNPLTVALPTGAYTIEAYWTAQEATQSRDFVVVDAARTIVIPFEGPSQSATIVAPATAPIGSTIEVGWSGPDAQNDYVGIGAADAEGGSRWQNYAYTRDGNPAELLMPPTPGEHVIAYFLGEGREEIGQTSITLTPVEVSITAPASAALGETIEIGWVGPNYANDYIGIAPSDASGGQTTNYTYTREGAPLDLQMPAESGDYVITYFMAQGRTAMVSVPITIEDVEATLTAPASAQAGTTIEVGWTGPDEENDYIGIGKVDATGGAQWQNYTYTREGTPLELQIPPEPGEYLITYFLAQDRTPLTSVSITVEEVGATIVAPDTAVVGETIEIGWTGPNEENDYIGIGKADATGGAQWQNYTYTRDGTPLDLEMPTDPGDYLITYFLAQDRTPLTTVSITLSDVLTEIVAPTTAVAGSTIEVDWTGPDYDNDYIGIGRADATGGAQWQNYSYTRDGTPAELLVPILPGDYLITYFMAQDRVTKAQAAITVTPVEATLAAPASAAAGSSVEIGWTGPDYENDYIGIGRAGESGGRQWEAYAYTRTGNPVQIEVPETPGDYVIRYFANQNRTELVSVPLTVE